MVTWSRYLQPGEVSTEQIGSGRVYRLGLYRHWDATMPHTLNILDGLHQASPFQAVWGHYLFPAGFLGVWFGRQISGAGYNTVFECYALGKPLIAFAWPRQYDRQRHRGQQWAQLVETPQAAIDAVKDLLQASRNPNQIQLYRNGIGDAIAIIDKTYSAP